LSAGIRLAVNAAAAARAIRYFGRPLDPEDAVVHAK
jgi:hypothetical protein